MRIGILTFHSQLNYGGVLQCWALRRALENLGHPSCELKARMVAEANELPTMGKNYGDNMRKSCVEVLATSKFFNEEVVRLLIREGTFKRRLLFMAYAVVPICVKKILLKLF